MRNELSKSPATLSAQIEDALPGVTKYAAPLGLPAGTEEALGAAMADIVTSDNSYRKGKDDLKTRRTALKAVFKSSTVFCTLVRERLKPNLGAVYTQAWDVVGFVGSLRMPTKVEGMLPLLQCIGKYFTDHPDLENGDITAARATTLHEDLSSARTTVNEGKANRDRLYTMRMQKATAGRRQLRGLLYDLGLAMGPLDPRWLEFGFNKPGAQAIPDIPENVTAVLAEANRVAVQWSAASRAEHYRVWKKITGIDAEFIAVGSVADLDFVTDGFPSNATIEIAVSAVNNGGESDRSPVVTIMTQ